MKKNIKKELASKLIELLEKIFKERSNIETLKKILDKKAILVPQEKGQKINDYIQKDKPKILLKDILKKKLNYLIFNIQFYDYLISFYKSISFSDYYINFALIVCLILSLFFDFVLLILALFFDFVL